MCKVTVLHIKHTLGGESNPFRHCETQSNQNDSPTKLLKSKRKKTKIDKNFLRQGQLHLKRREYNSALEAFFSAIKVTDDLFHHSQLYSSIADVYMQMPLNIDNAIEYYTKSQTLLNQSQHNSELNDDSIQLQLSVGKKLGDALFETAQYRAALQSYTGLLGVIPSEGNDELKCGIRYRIGLIMYYQGDDNDSLYNLWIALKCVRSVTNYYDGPNNIKDSSIGNEMYMATLLYCLGLVHESRTEYAWAYSRLTESLAIQRRRSLTLDFSEMRISTLSHASYCSKKLGNIDDSNALKKSAKLTTIKIAKILDDAKKNNRLSSLDLDDKNVLEDARLAWQVSRQIVLARRAPGRYHATVSIDSGYELIESGTISMNY